MSSSNSCFAALLVLGNGFFVGAEFALVSVRRSQIEPLAAGGRARAPAGCCTGWSTCRR